MANYDWPFGTLPFGLFWSNLDTKDLETYPRIFKKNQNISFSLRLIEFWCLGLPVALGRGQVGGWGVWGHGCVPTCMHMHVHARTHMYKIANGCQHGDIHV